MLYTIYNFVEFSKIEKYKINITNQMCNCVLFIKKKRRAEFMICIITKYHYTNYKCFEIKW